jgi:hypothetical protein
MTEKQNYHMQDVGAGEKIPVENQRRVAWRGGARRVRGWIGYGIVISYRGCRIYIYIYYNYI